MGQIEEFKEWLKTGKSKDIEGGYIIPNTIKLQTKGIMGKIYRFLKIKKGWYDYHIYDELVKNIKNGEIK